MSVVTQPFHAVVNHLLAREPWAQAQLLPYVGKRARLIASPFSFLVQVAPSGLLEAGPRAIDGVDDPATEPDVVITVLPDALAAMIQGGSAAMMKHVRISGDAEFAATLGKLAEHVRWDPEEDLSRFIGDAPAYRVVLTAKTAVEQVGRASRGLLGSLAEYLLDEKPRLVRHRAVEQFTRDLAELRDDVERFEKRLERLERRAAAAGSGSTSSSVTDVSTIPLPPVAPALAAPAALPASPGIPAMPKSFGRDR